MTEVAVTGANGFVGSHLRQELVGRGFAVRGLVRSQPREKDPFTTSQLVEVDYDDAPSVIRALDGADAVVHLVGHAHQSTADAAVYRRVNVDYTRRVLEGAAQVGAGRFLFLSSVKVLGNGADEPYSEQTVPRPEDAYGRSKLEAETEVRSLAGPSGVDHVILRPPLVYGAGVKGNLQRLIAAIERRRPIPVARSTANARSLISARNLASAIVDTLAWTVPINDTYLVADSEDVSTAALIETIARVAGTRARTLPIPPSLLRGLANVVHQGPAAQRFLGSLRVDATKFNTYFGWRPPQTLEEGLREAVEGYRSAARRG